MCHRYTHSLTLISDPLIRHDAVISGYVCTQQGAALQSSRVYRVWSVKLFHESPLLKKPATTDSQVS